MSMFVFFLLAIMIGVRVYLYKTYSKSNKNILPEDNNKEPKSLKYKMDKLYLHHSILDDKELGILPNIDHRKELTADIDEYMRNMKPFVKTTAADIALPKEDFVHIGYSFQGDWYDLNAVHLYNSKRWEKDLKAYMPESKNSLNSKIRRMFYV